MAATKKEKKPSEVTLARLKKYLSLYRNKAGRYWLMQFVNPALSCLMTALWAVLYRDVINALAGGSFALLLDSLWIAAVIFAGDLSSVWFHYLHMYYTRHIMQELQTRVFRHLENLPQSYFDKHHTAESIQRLCVNTNHLKNALAQMHPRFIGVIIQGGFSIVFILLLDWRLGLVTIASSAIALRLNLLLTKPLSGMARRIQNTLETCTARLTDLLAGMRVIHMFPGARRMIDSYFDANDELAAQTVKRYSRLGVVSGVGDIFGFACHIGILLAGIFMAGAGMIDLGTVVAVQSLQGSVSWFLRSIGGHWGNLKEHFVLGDRVFEVLDEPLEPERYETPCGDGEYGLLLKDACFSYDGESNVLNGISLEVARGKTVALVGASGGGKSTVIRLLLGFYALTGGEAGLLGKAVGGYSLAEIRDQIAYVPQDAYLFAASIKENIRFGKPGATDQEIIDAAKRAYAHDFIISLPNGYDTLVGERGESLSGGQRQRVAIARAFVKSAPILLLDEATSALDSESELLVQKGIEALMEGRTTLVVAHRLSTIERADRIYVLEDGVACEEGTHHSLLERDGVYSRLVAMGLKSGAPSRA